MKSYAIKALSGSLSGQIFHLKEKLVFGRSTGDVVLKELSVSNPHGEVKQQADGRVMLQDLDSKNGILIDGKAQATVFLETGMVFTIGGSDFQLIAFKSPEEVWLDFLNDNMKNIKNKPRKLQAFAKPVRINFIEGPQKGMKFVLGYGPRSFGSGCVDVPLLDSKIPDKAFKLIPKDKSLDFYTKYPELYMKSRSGKPKSTLSLGEDGIIVCGDTKLHISFK